MHDEKYDRLDVLIIACEKADCVYADSSSSASGNGLKI